MELTKQQEEYIIKLQDDSKLETDLIYIIKESDATDIDELSEYIDEQTNGFEVEITYYNKALEYLTDNDPSLQYSLKIAHDIGYTTNQLDSELLATLLATKNEREAYDEIKDELNDILFVKE